MSDYSDRYTDKKISEVDRELKRTYRTAQTELKKKLADFNKRFAQKSREKKQQVKDGKITEQEYKDWLTGQVFIRNQWQSQINAVNSVLLDHNKQAIKIINNGTLDVFAESYNFNAFRAESMIAASFTVYNAESVARLILGDPQLLPEWKINEKKDYAWNYDKVNNIVRQAIIQGKGVEEITGELCSRLSTTNESKMRMFARTALGSAQNAGRQKQMEDAAALGIEVNKQWEAAHDSKTRDSHRALDGEEVPYDEEFSNGLMFPKDPTGAPEEVYNCRCAMKTIYLKYEDRTKPDWREEEVIDGESYREWKKFDNYAEWKKWKEETGQVKGKHPEEPKPGEPSQLEKKVKKQVERTPHKLTDAEHQAIEDYVSGDMMFINQILRGRAGGLTDDDKEFVKLMDSALSDPLGKAQTLFRSVDADAVFGKISDSDYQNMITYLLYGKDSFGKGSYADSIRKQVEGIVSRTDGNTITEKGYMSTTKDKELAFDWGGFTGSEKPVVLEIKAPPGTSGRDLKEFDINGDEQQEVLLDRGQKYKITGIHGENGSIVVTVEIIERDEKGK